MKLLKKKNESSVFSRPRRRRGASHRDKVAAAAAVAAVAAVVVVLRSARAPDGKDTVVVILLPLLQLLCEIRRLPEGSSGGVFLAFLLFARCPCGGSGGSNDGAFRRCCPSPRSTAEMLRGPGEHLREPEEVERIHRDVGGEAEDEGGRRDVFFVRVAAERQRRPQLGPGRNPPPQRRPRPADDPREEEARHHREAAEGVRFAFAVAVVVAVASARLARFLSSLFVPFLRCGERPASVDERRRRLPEQEHRGEVREAPRERAQAEERAADEAVREESGADAPAFFFREKKY